jgi:hypothetical protein
MCELLTGTLTFLGGVAAYVRVRSVPSAIAGFVFGSALVASSALVRKGLDDKYDGRLGFACSAGSFPVMQTNKNLLFSCNFVLNRLYLDEAIFDFWQFFYFFPSLQKKKTKQEAQGC